MKNNELPNVSKIESDTRKVERYNREGDNALNPIFRHQGNVLCLIYYTVKINYHRNTILY